MSERLRIDRLSAAGDGVAETGLGPVYVPFALPGETVALSRDGDRAELLSIDDAHADRILPFCPYFGRCGGCVAQHVGPPLYDGWKRGKVVEALARAGLATPVEPLIDAHGVGRRRLVLHVRFEGREPRIGFMEARSHRLVAIDACPVSTAALRRAPQVAAALAVELIRADKPLDVAVTDTEGGLDVELRGSGPPGERQRQALIARAGELDLARLAVHGDILIERRPPTVVVGQARVALPPGGFLQATEAGEAALAREVLSGIGGARRVLDLFAGIGPFALRLAERAQVHAVDSAPAMLAALDRAVRAASGLRQVTTEPRDLFRRPLLASELGRYDAVVLDPPRSGAAAQVEQVSRSPLGDAVMVSCDPGTFARDAASLVAGGFSIERVVPIDQFKWSKHVEIVGVFRRKRAMKRS